MISFENGINTTELSDTVDKNHTAMIISELLNVIPKLIKEFDNNRTISLTLVSYIGEKFKFKCFSDGGISEARRINSFNRVDTEYVNILSNILYDVNRNAGGVILNRDKILEIQSSRYVGNVSYVKEISLISYLYKCLTDEDKSIILLKAIICDIIEIVQYIKLTYIQRLNQYRYNMTTDTSFTSNYRNGYMSLNNNGYSIGSGYDNGSLSYIHINNTSDFGHTSTLGNNIIQYPSIYMVDNIEDYIRILYSMIYGTRINMKDADTILYEIIYECISIYVEYFSEKLPRRIIMGLDTITNIIQDTVVKQGNVYINTDSLMHKLFTELAIKCNVIYDKITYRVLEYDSVIIKPNLDIIQNENSYLYNYITDKPYSDGIKDSFEIYLWKDRLGYVPQLNNVRELTPEHIYTFKQNKKILTHFINILGTLVDKKAMFDDCTYINNGVSSHDIKSAYDIACMGLYDLYSKGYVDIRQIGELVDRDANIKDPKYVNILRHVIVNAETYMKVHTDNSDSISHGRLSNLIKTIYSSKIVEFKGVNGNTKITYECALSNYKKYKFASAVKYNNIDRNMPLAMECVKFKYNESLYETCIAVDYLSKIFKASNSIPNVRVESENYVLERLPDGDPRAFTLGEYTDCCQHIGGMGDTCTDAGVSLSMSGFYILTKKDDGAIVSQAWVWRYKDTLIFDNIESLYDKDHPRTCEIKELWTACAKKLIGIFGIIQVRVGLGHNDEFGSDDVIKHSSNELSKQYIRNEYYEYKIKIRKIITEKNNIPLDMSYINVKHEELMIGKELYLDYDRYIILAQDKDKLIQVLKCTDMPIIDSTKTYRCDICSRSDRDKSYDRLHGLLSKSNLNIEDILQSDGVTVYNIADVGSKELDMMRRYFVTRNEGVANVPTGEFAAIG